MASDSSSVPIENRSRGVFGGNHSLRRSPTALEAQRTTRTLPLLRTGAESGLSAVTYGPLQFCPMLEPFPFAFRPFWANIWCFLLRPKRRRTPIPTRFVHIGHMIPEP